MPSEQPSPREYLPKNRVDMESLESAVMAALPDNCYSYRSFIKDLLPYLPMDQMEIALRLAKSQK